MQGVPRGIVDLPSGESTFATGVVRSLGEARGGAPIGLANFPVAYCGLKKTSLCCAPFP